MIGTQAYLLPHFHPAPSDWELQDLSSGPATINCMCGLEQVTQSPWDLDFPSVKWG